MQATWSSSNWRDQRSCLRILMWFLLTKLKIWLQVRMHVCVCALKSHYHLCWLHCYSAAHNILYITYAVWSSQHCFMPWHVVLHAYIYLTLLATLNIHTHPAIIDILTNQDSAKIVVGDPNQQIYSFLGASNALDQIEATRTYHLTRVWETICWCGLSHGCPYRECICPSHSGLDQRLPMPVPLLSIPSIPRGDSFL